jgi:hypothetical protein
MPLRWKADVDRNLEPRFLRDIEQLLGVSSPFEWKVTFGRRSMEDQDELYQIFRAGGPRAAPAGRSPHNYGLAIDVVLDGVAGPGESLTWDTKRAGWVWLFGALEHHPRLHSGVSFGDGGHIEKATWIDYKEWNAP